MHVRLLGQIEALNGDPLALGGPTQRRVLAALALRRNEVVSIPHLVDVIWSDDEPPERAEHNVRTYVHRLRSSLDSNGDRVETAGAGYLLRLGTDELDAATFEQLAGTARRLADTGDAVAALDLIDEAERLWRGDPIAEFETESWAMPDAVRLRELHTELRTQRAAALIELGRAANAVAPLEAWVRDEPLREWPRALLMRALYESGRQAEALRAFQQFRQSLIDEVGVEPSTDLVELDRAIATGALAPGEDRTRAVGGYELHERIGEGAFAVVHRATQTALGREVAVKIIRAELANRPEFIRRFEAEAQMVARIEHPSVVPLYDYWREPDRAFLVMRWMTGGSLETRLDDGPWAIDDTLALVEEIAAALDAAHSQGVVHRDVKPENILFDAEGRAYLGDFGIALDAAERSRPEAALSEGSPVFASPEQLRREPVGPEADVHALAIVAFTLFAGRTPFADTLDEPTRLQRQLHEPIPPVRAIRPEMPAGVDEVLAVATAKRASDRYPTAPAFAAALRAAVLSEAPASSVPVRTLRPRANPYKGLRAFDETDAADFHGRERLVDELVDHLGQSDNRLLAVVGPSGSGKSSVVRAGLIPALRNGRVGGSSQWFATTLIPGARPFEALETALLRIAVNPPSALLDQLRDGDRGILRAVRRVLPGDDDVVAVTIDQFEELFAGAVPDDDRDLFLRALAVAATEPGSPVRFVITLRADFYDRPLRHPEFAPLLKRHTVVVTPLAPDELEHAIVTPAAAVGVGFEPGLVAEMIADVNHEPGALPLLQYALTQVFDATEGDTLTIDAYRSIGGLAGALGSRAEELWQSADDDERGAARRLFGRLVTLGEGVEDTRRRAHLSEIGDDDATRSAIDRFGRARLLTFDHDPATREPTVEIAHEALIREWPRLREWLDDDRDTLRTHRHLTAAAAGWLAQDRDPGELYRGGRLDGAEPLLTTDTVALNAPETEFLRASLDRRDADRRAERTRVRRLRRLVTATAVVAVLALIAGAFAFRQQQRADDQAALAAENEAQAVQSAELADQRAYDAETARLAATARLLAPSKPREAMLLAVAAHQREQSPTTLGALHAALAEAGPRLGYMGWGTDYIDVAWMGNGRVVGIRRDGLDLWDPETGRLLDSEQIDIWELAPGLATIGRGAAGGSDLLAVASADTVVHVFVVGDELEKQFEKSLPSPAVAVAVAPDGETVVATSADGTVAAWSRDGRDRFPPFVVPIPANQAAQHDAMSEDLLGGRDFFSSEPVYAVPVAHEGHIHVMVGATTFSVDYDGTPMNDLVYTFADLADVGSLGLLPARVVHVVHPTPDETVVMSASSIGRIATGGDPALRGRLRVAEGSGVGGDTIIHAFAGPDGRPVALLDDGTFVWFDLDTGERLESLDSGGGSAQSAASGPQPGEFAVASERGIALVSVDGVGPIEQAVPREPGQSQLSPSHDGRFVVLGGSGIPAPVTVLEHDADTGEYRVRSDFPVEAAFYASAGPDHGDTGQGLFVAGEVVEGLAFGDSGLPSYLFALKEPDAPTLFLRTTELDGLNAGDGDPLNRWFVADSNATSKVHVYDQTSGAILRQLPLPPGTLPDQGASGIRFHPSGDRLLVSSRTGRSQLWDTETWALLGDETLAEYDIALGYWSLDGSLLATAAADGQITIRDGETFEPIRQLVGATGTFNNWAGGPLLFSEDNVFLLTDHDNVARLWDVATGQQVGNDMTTADDTNSGINHGDSLQLVTGTEQSALVWNLDVESWPETACRTAGSNLSQAEWEQWGPRDEEYRAVCEAFPLDR